MTREEFYQHVESFIMGMLPEKFADMTPVIQPSVNQGGRYMGMLLQNEDEIGISPNFNLDWYYDRYKDMDEIEMLMAISEDIVHHYQENSRYMDRMREESIRAVNDYEYAKTKLFIAPVSMIRQSEGNVEPCMMFEDLCIQVRIKFDGEWSQNNRMVASTVVTEAILERWEKSFEEVYRDAAENTPKIAEIQILQLQELLETQMGVDFDFPDELGLLILKNSINNHGAAALFLPGVMDEIADRVQGSYIVIPSSVNELIIYPLNAAQGEITMDDVSEIEAMIQGVNETNLEPDEILSNRAYFYNAQTKEFGLAADAVMLAKDHRLTNMEVLQNDFHEPVNYDEASKNIISGVFRPQNY